MPDALSNALMVLCHADGRIVTADREAVLLLGNETGEVTISQIATRADCAQLTAMFESFAAGELAYAKSIAVCGDAECEVSLRRLNGFQSQPLIAVEMNRLRQLSAGQDSAALLEVGRATSRLIHDFKNQMSGVKLYAAYLKKRFADQPEGVEIAEKIVQSLNEMAENASLIGKLTQPVELKLLEEDFAALVKHVVYGMQPQAAARNVEIVSRYMVAEPRLLLDSQQMRLALNSLLAQAVEASPVGGMVTVALQTRGNKLRLSISSVGDALSEEQQLAFFDFLTTERLNKTSLSLALARRIIEAHGGTAEVLAAQPAQREIRVELGI